MLNKKCYRRINFIVKLDVEDGSTVMMCLTEHLQLVTCHDMTYDKKTVEFYVIEDS